MISRKDFKPLSGVVTPLLTPFTTKGPIDYEALEKLIHYVMEGGVGGMFVLGTTGEGACMSMEDRCELVNRVIECASSRTPIVVNLSDPVLENGIRLARHAEARGADALSLMPPSGFYATQEEIWAYFKKISTVTSLPLYLYNYPAIARAAIEPSTVARISRLPRIAGMKDSSGDGEYFNEVLNSGIDRKTFTLLVGSEAMMAEGVASGASGGVCGGSNLFPQLYVELYQAAEKGDASRVDQLQKIVLMIDSQLYSLSEGENRCIRVAKYILSLSGMCEETMAQPYCGLVEDKKRSAKERLDLVLQSLEEAGIPALVAT